MRTTNRALFAWVTACALAVAILLTPIPRQRSQRTASIKTPNSAACGVVCGLVLGFLLERAYQALSDQNVPNKGVGGGGGDGF